MTTPPFIVGDEIQQINAPAVRGTVRFVGKRVFVIEDAAGVEVAWKEWGDQPLFTGWMRYIPQMWRRWRTVSFSELLRLPSTMTDAFNEILAECPPEYLGGTITSWVEQDFSLRNGDEIRLCVEVCAK